MSAHRSSDIVLHEVGHSLGFIHEYYRNDGVGIPCNYNGNDLNLENASGIKLTTDYDPLSIMNESYCRPNFSGLSPRDTLGLQAAYGRPWAGSIVNTTSGECLTHSVDPNYGISMPLLTQGCSGSSVQKWQYGDTPNNKPSAIHNTALGRTNKLRIVYQDWEVALYASGEPFFTEEQWSFLDARIMGLGYMCLGVSDAPVDGENAKLVKCDGDRVGQKWQINYSGRAGYYTIKSQANSALCLNSSSVDGSGTMKVGACTGGNAHLRQFKFGQGQGSFMIPKSETSTDHVCMGVKDGKPDYDQGAVGVVCNNALEQQWVITGKLKNSSTQKCLTQTNLTGPSGNVRMEPCDQDLQTWDYYP